MRIALVERGRRRIWALIFTLAAAVFTFAAGILSGGNPLAITIIAALVGIAALFTLGTRIHIHAWWGAALLTLALAVFGFVILQGCIHATPSRRAIFFGFFLCLAFVLLLRAIIGNIRAAGIVWVSFCLIYGVINYCVLKFRGSIITMQDFTSIQTALSVAGNYSFKSNWLLNTCAYLSACCIILLARIQFSCRAAHRRKLRLRCLALAVLLVAFPASQAKKYTPKYWNDEGARRNGVFMQYLCELAHMQNEKPEGYSAELVSALMPDAAPASVPAGEKPHIIAIMIEAYSDLSVLGSFETSADEMSFFNELKQEAIHGQALSSVLGGSTANSEWEFLTGNTMGFLPGSAIPYRQYMQNDPNSLVDVLKNQGYRCIAMHPYKPKGWSRNTVYPALGFDEIYFKDDMDWGETVRKYVSDSAFMNAVIRKFEEHSSDEPLFLFGITMQNHGGYTDEEFKGEVRIEDMKGEYPEANQYLSLIKLTDDAIRELIAYFENVDEKVQIILFGDHQPNLEAGFYSALGVKNDQFKRIVPFLIWNNYDQNSTEYPLTSLNYLSSILLESAGLELPPYNRFLLEMQEEIPAINSLGYVNAQGKAGEISSAEGETAELLNQYRVLQYANLLDESTDDSLYVGTIK